MNNKSELQTYLLLLTQKSCLQRPCLSNTASVDVKKHTSKLLEMLKIA